MATRLVVMKDGYIQQVGTPKDVYDFPNNVFVGGFIDSPAMNFFTGILTADGFMMGDTKIHLPADKHALLKDKGYEGQEVIMGVRPEDIYTSVADIESNAASTFSATIEVAELLGAETYLYSNVNGSDFIARIESNTTIQPMDTIPLAFDMTKAHFFDKETENRIH